MKSGILGWVMNKVAGALVRSGMGASKAFGVIKNVIPGASFSRFSSLFRAAEQREYAETTPRVTPDNLPFPISSMIESDRLKVRRYLVTFDVGGINKLTGEEWTGKMHAYFQEHESANNYAALFLYDFNNNISEYEVELKWARTASVEHNKGYSY